MKKKTVTSETEEITIDNKKQKRKREKKAYREIRWDRLDNTAHLFPVIAGEKQCLPHQCDTDGACTA